MQQNQQQLKYDTDKQKCLAGNQCDDAVTARLCCMWRDCCFFDCQPFAAPAFWSSVLRQNNHAARAARLFFEGIVHSSPAASVEPTEDPVNRKCGHKNKKPLTNFLVVSIPKIGVTTGTNESLGDELQQMLCSALRPVLRHSPYSCMTLGRFIRKCVSPGGND